MTEGVSGPQPPERHKEMGAKPPASKDVQQFVKQQKEIEQLEALLAIAQSMVNEQLQKARSEGKRLSLKTVAIPPSGNAEQKTNIALYNTLQPALAVQIQSLVKQVSILKADSPASAQTYNTHLTNLEEIAKSFPKLSQDQMQTINTMIDHLHTQVKQASPAAQTTFWQEVEEMSRKMFLATAKEQRKIEGPTAQQTSDYLDRTQDLAIQTAGTAFVKEGESRGPDALAQKYQEFKSDPQVGAPKPQKEATSSQNLSHAFKNAMNNFFKNEMQMLEDLEAIMSILNSGGTIANNIGNFVSDFSAAKSNYGLSGLLHQVPGAPGTYSGYSSASQQLANEKTAAANDIKNIGSATTPPPNGSGALGAVTKGINNLQSKLNALDKIPAADRTPTQNKEISTLTNLINQLKTIQGNLTVALTQLQSLLQVLNGITMTPGANNTFTVTWTGGTTDPQPAGGWAAALSKDESQVVNGQTANAQGYTGGLNKIASEYNAFSSSTQSQTQTEQMQVSLDYTVFQQKVSIMSTMLQTLNQALMSPAQAIYK